jgi:hypothetical protein
MKSFQLLGLVALAGVALRGQPPTTGAQYWSTDPNLDCSSAGSQTYQITLVAGGNGYVCIVSGTFLWLAAGGSWSTSVRVAAPASGAIGVDYSFYDANGSALTLDTTSGTGAVPASSNDVNFALKANQPSEVRLLGSANEAPNYGTTQTGSAYAIFYCPDAFSCSVVLPQLLYSFSPTKPWLLSVPISWDNFYSQVQAGGAWTQWSAAGINSATDFVSLVIYNQSTVAAIFTVRVYDSSGALVGQATTPAIPGFDSVTQEGGTYGVLLSTLITTPLPSGSFKITVDGGANSSSVSVLQFSGASASSLQVAYDTTSSSSSNTTLALRRNVRRARVRSTAKPVLSPLTK